MSDDLISRKRLKEAIHADFAEHFTLYHDSDQTALIDMIMDDIDEVPTAFDKEKVIEELKEEGCIIDDEAGNKAVEIIEKGGLDE